MAWGSEQKELPMWPYAALPARVLWASTLGDDQQALLRIRSCLASPGFSGPASLGAGQLRMAAVASSVCSKSISIAKSSSMFTHPTFRPSDKW